MDEVDFETMRQRVHDSLAEIVSEEEKKPEVVTGWVLIYETAGVDNSRSLTVLTANASGDEPISPWLGEGLLHHVAANYGLYESFEYMEEEDEEEDPTEE